MTIFEYKGHQIEVEGCYIRKTPFVISIDGEREAGHWMCSELAAIEIAKQIIDEGGAASKV
jgi:hypothetical protein